MSELVKMGMSFHPKGQRDKPILEREGVNRMDCNTCSSYELLKGMHHKQVSDALWTLVRTSPDVNGMAALTVSKNVTAELIRMLETCGYTCGYVCGIRYYDIVWMKRG